jgi:hypothetical protein
MEPDTDILEWNASTKQIQIWNMNEHNQT